MKYINIIRILVYCSSIIFTYGSNLVPLYNNTVDFIFQGNFQERWRRSTKISNVALTQHVTGGVESDVILSPCFCPSQRMNSPRRIDLTEHTIQHSVLAENDTGIKMRSTLSLKELLIRYFYVIN